MSGDSFDPFENPGEARAWLGRFLEKVSNGEKVPTSRANTLFKGLDVWCRLYRLQTDTRDIEELKKEIAEFREQMSPGPVGVVIDGQ